jgi:ribosomal protein L37AE/L43A
MKHSLTLTTLLLGLTIGMTSLCSHANNPNPKPNCPLGQIATQEKGIWKCAEPALKSNEDNTTEIGLLLPAVQKVRASSAQPDSSPRDAASGLPTGKRQHQPTSGLPTGKRQHSPIKPTKPTAGAPADKPNCPKGQLPKFENGVWRCKAMAITAATKPQASNPAGEKPKCPKGELPKIENGHWVCKKPGFSAGKQPGDE